MRRLSKVVLLLALAGCQARQPATPDAEAGARRYSQRAARLDSTAQQLYTAARAAADSATFYHFQSHAKSTATPDTAVLRRFFAGYAR